MTSAEVGCSRICGTIKSNQERSKNWTQNRLFPQSKRVEEGCEYGEGKAEEEEEEEEVEGVWDDG